MLQRFASALFGGEVEELSPPGPAEEKEAEEDEDWILVNYLAEGCSAQRGSAHPGSALGPEEEEEEDLVMIPSPVASPPVRYASCTSLNSTAETDPDGGAEEEEEEEEGGFFRLDAASLEESWFVTPPPCFTGRGAQPALEASPLEDLLIEHPSMSVYACRGPPRGPPRRALDALPRSLDLALLPDNKAAAPKSRCEGVKKVRRSLDGPHRRPDASIFQRHSSQHAACGAAARAGLLRQHVTAAAPATPPLSRNALRRLNLLRPPKANGVHLHQPSQRHLNF